MTSLETLKAEMAQAAAEMAAKKVELANAMKKLREESQKLKDQEREAKIGVKKAEAEKRAEAMRKAMESGVVAKVNMTETIRTKLMMGLDIDQIQAETGFGRKAILDRVWLIEKKLGIR